MIKRLVGSLPCLRFIQVAELPTEQFLAGPESDGLAGILLRHGLQGFFAGVLVTSPVRRVISQVAFTGILSGHFGLQSIVYLVVGNLGIRPVPQQMPQDILVVRCHEIFHSTSHQTIDAPV